MSKWQPIETAPKDGTPIIVANKDEATVAKYCADDERWICMLGNKKTVKSSDGKVIYAELLIPTVWKPIPKPIFL